MLSTIDVYQKAAALGIKLGVEPPDTLTFEPSERCPPDFTDTLRSYKPRLIALLLLPFVMVDSKAVGEILFFCADDATKVALQDAGADSFSIYTKAELQILCEQNRIAPISADELRKVHELKRTFSGKLAPSKKDNTEGSN
jgi:hypothetical protein